MAVLHSAKINEERLFFDCFLREDTMRAALAMLVVATFIVEVRAVIVAAQRCADEMQFTQRALG